MDEKDKKKSRVGREKEKLVREKGGEGKGTKGIKYITLCGIS